MTRSLDLGCGPTLRNPFDAEEVFGVDIAASPLVNGGNIRAADLAIEPIPFGDGEFDFVSAFDFIEHIPRTIYAPSRRHPFVELMNEVWRVLKPGGMFLSFTPAHPYAPAWRDPTHVNIITDETFPLYFCAPSPAAAIYGFRGSFELVSQEWRVPHLLTMLKKVC